MPDPFPTRPMSCSAALVFVGWYAVVVGVLHRTAPDWALTVYTVTFWGGLVHDLAFGVRPVHTPVTLALSLVGYVALGVMMYAWFTR